MPKTESIKSIAISEIEEWMRSEGIEYIKLFDKDKKENGWKLFKSWKGKNVRLDFIIDRFFPFSKITVRMRPTPKVLSLPHLESSGDFCIFTPEEVPSYNSAVDLFKKTLQKTFSLLDLYEKGLTRKEFEDEYQTYWRIFVNSKKPLERKEAWNLIDAPNQVANLMYSFRSERGVFISGDHEKIKHWQDNVVNDLRPLINKNVVTIQLSEIPIPEEYPCDLLSLIKLIKKEANWLELVKRLENSLIYEETRIILVCNQKAILGLNYNNLNAPKINKKKYRKSIKKLTQGKLEPFVVERADISWIYGRDTNKNIDNLSKKTVLIIGCGSIGSFVAKNLAQSGVGQLILIDDSSLEWCNISRHALGAQYLPRTDHKGNKIYASKAYRLNGHLGFCYPNIKIEHLCSSWEYAYERKKEFFEKADLIISSTASFNSECQLNILKQNGELKTPIIYSWTTPQAVTGHAIALLNNDSCFECGMSMEGKGLKENPIKLPEGGLQFREPSCGALFTPYGAIEMSYVTSMTSQLAMDVLLGKISTNIHRIWFSAKGSMQSFGITYSEEWEKKYGNIGLGSKIIEIPWKKSETCKICNQKTI